MMQLFLSVLLTDTDILLTLQLRKLRQSRQIPGLLTHPCSLLRGGDYWRAINFLIQDIRPSTHLPNVITEQTQAGLRPRRDRRKGKYWVRHQGKECGRRFQSRRVADGKAGKDEIRNSRTEL